MYDYFDTDTVHDQNPGWVAYFMAAIALTIAVGMTAGMFWAIHKAESPASTEDVVYSSLENPCVKDGVKSFTKPITNSQLVDIKQACRGK